MGINVLLSGAAEQETQEGDYVAALTQLEREAEERRQAAERETEREWQQQRETMILQKGRL